MSLDYKGWITDYKFGEIQVPDLNKSDLIKIIEKFRPRIFIEEDATMSYIKKSFKKEEEYYDGKIIILARMHIDTDKKEELQGRSLFHELLHLQVWLYYNPPSWDSWGIGTNYSEEEAIENEAIRLAKEQPELLEYFSRALEAYRKGPKTFEHFKKHENMNNLSIKQKELDLK